MESLCSPARRCRRLSCRTCAWRAAGYFAARFSFGLRGRAYAVILATSIRTVAEFTQWRTALRNFIDHRRRRCRWWRSVSLDLWLQADGTVRGVVRLGEINADEFVPDLADRWAVTMRPIDLGEVRVELFYALHPTRIADFGIARRYQGVRVTIGPQVARTRCPRPPRATDALVPLPMLNLFGEVAMQRSCDFYPSGATHDGRAVSTSPHWATLAGLLQPIDALPCWRKLSPM